jgi:hypothetical protein
MGDARYACAEALVVDYLHDHETLGALLHAYFSPDWELMGLVAELCTQGEVALRPHRLLGASCSLRLRQLLGDADL